MSLYHTKTNLKADRKNWQIVLSWFFPYGLPNGRRTRRLLIVSLSLGVLGTGCMYGIAEWYIHSTPGVTSLGVSFIPDYAESLGVDPHQTMDSLINIGVKQFRLVSYWSDAEPIPGHYDFSQLDWQFQKAEAAHANISLSIGLRQPRWPECHMPDWAAKEPTGVWTPQLLNYMQAVILRYRSSPALKSYQLENEFYLKNFGTCTDSDPSRLQSEFSLLRRLDSQRQIIMSRSNNGPQPLPAPPRADIVGTSIYRRVWDGQFTHRYLNYPLPSWYYAFTAGVQKLVGGQDSIVHELQAEPWPPNGKSINQISLTEQNKSFNAGSLHERVQFAKATGKRSIDLWGAEYWYYRMTVMHDPSVWNSARVEFRSQD